MELKNLNILIFYLLCLIYISFSLLTTLDTTSLNTSAEKILFNGKFIEWLGSSVTSSGRFVPFSNGINIFIFQFTDNLFVFFVAKIILITTNFYFLYKVFEELKLSKFYPIAIILCLFNHSFNNAIYITSFEIELSFLITIFFYLELLNIKRNRVLIDILQILVLIYLLGLKESMFGFFLFYNIASYFFKIKRKNIIISSILIIYLSTYTLIVLSSLDLDNIYGNKNIENKLIFSFIKNASQYVISFPLITLIFLICNITYFNFLYLKKKKLNEYEKIFIVILAGIIGYFSIYLSLRIFAFRYVYPIIIIILPIFFYSFKNLNVKLIGFLLIVFFIGPFSSTYLGLKNQINAKEFNLEMKQELIKHDNKKNILLIHNFSDNKRYIIDGQLNDLGLIDNLKIFFKDKNLIEKIYKNEIYSDLDKEELREFQLVIILFQNYQFDIFNIIPDIKQKETLEIERKCNQTIILKKLIFKKECSENLKLIVYNTNDSNNFNKTY